MVCGFLGTLISLERAMAFGRPWAFALPAATIVGSDLLLTGVWSNGGIALICLASLMLVVLFGIMLWRQPIEAIEGR